MAGAELVEGAEEAPGGVAEHDHDVGQHHQHADAAGVDGGGQQLVLQHEHHEELANGRHLRDRREGVVGIPDERFEIAALQQRAERDDAADDDLHRGSAREEDEQTCEGQPPEALHYFIILASWFVRLGFEGGMNDK